VPSDGSGARRAAVVGSPVAHSLSPVLHIAAYTALGLVDWRYDRLELDGDGLTATVPTLGPAWVGLSVTMPGKQAALALADAASQRAMAVGAANTLLRRDDGWFADCTDIDGVAGALRAAGDPLPAGSVGAVLGAGGTAAAALAGLAVLGVTSVVSVVREPARAAALVDCAARLGVELIVRRWSDEVLSGLADEVSVLVSTVPPAAVASSAARLAAVSAVLDVIYHPWPTPIAVARSAAGLPLATGLDMLLHQAFGQVELFTGMSAPREPMRDALAATSGVQLLPLP